MTAAATPAARSSLPDVSVIVPVYNPGPFIEVCIRGLLSQTLDASRCEFIFVDDGSTDGTPERLAALARQHSNVVVRLEPHSGWPGRPRNVGVDIATGEFVFFCDHDDWLEPDGLETLVTTARRTDADIVVGKVVGLRRKVPLELFRNSRDHATVFDSELMWLLTPHKLFRRSFLHEAGIRFPEGKRRLEDHTFVTAAYFAAGSIAIVADRPIYHHVQREDLGNAAYSGFDPVSYYRYAREAMDIVAEHTEPGTTRDRLMWRFLRGQMLERLSEPVALRASDDELGLAFGEIRTLLQERYPDSALDLLRPVPRARARAIRDGRLDLIRDIAQRAADVVASGTVSTVSDGAGKWRLQVDASLVDHAGELLRLRQTPEGWLVPQVVPADVGDRPATTEEVMASARARVTVREQQTWEEWILPASVVPHLVALASAADGTHALSIDVAADLDLSSAAGGHPLPVGRWDLAVGVTGVGLTRRSRLVISEDCPLPLPVIYGTPPRIARLATTRNGRKLRLEVTRPARGLAAVVAPGLPSPVPASRDRLAVTLPVAAAADLRPIRCWIELRAPGQQRGPRYRAVIRRTKSGVVRLAASFPSTRRPPAGGCELWLGFGNKRPMSRIADVDVRGARRRSLRQRVRSLLAARPRR